ncbi:MAG: cobaltochelatase subunit CobN, partial [Staphylothermus sp.]|nr:cobaltochelatase subunit CobN [Staphylothermus sp.]
SKDCAPDALIGCMPNIYVYNVINPSEASIAKRRSYAVIITHSPPPYQKYDPPEEIVSLEIKLKQYYEAKQFSEERANETLKEILIKAQKLGLGNNIDEIHDRLEEYKRSLLPRGLHVLGEKPSQDEVLDYLVFLTRRDLGENPSIHRLVAEAEGFNYDEILTGKKRKLLQYIEDKVRRLLQLVLIDGQDVKKVIEQLDLKNIDREKLTKTITYLKTIRENIESSNEIDSITRALNGEYIMPSPGGDPLRNPEIYPTGRNMYQLDPYNIPTSTAWRRGVEAAEALLKKYYEKHGKYPRTVSIVLWAFETMKTGGETLAMIFWLLGVKPIWKTPYVRDIEIIPLEELGRPRIDVLVTICGIFRDTFYNMVELLDKAFKKVANLNEPLDKNYVRANNMEIRKIQGIEYVPRIYGPPPDKYATELTTLIETGSWRTEEELAQAYYESMKYAYGVNIHGKEMGKTLASLAKNSEVAIQIRDTIDYDITDLDHYYEFLGGLSKYIETTRGEKPMILVADSTKENIQVEDINESIRRGVITRILNPKWINEMLKHKHHGGEKIATRVENLLGLAATTNQVENWVWDNIANKLVFNEESRQKIQENNPWAMKKIIEKLIEAHTRGYWKAKRERIDRLKQVLE